MTPVTLQSTTFPITIHNFPKFSTILLSTSNIFLNSHQTASTHLLCMFSKNVDYSCCNTTPKRHSQTLKIKTIICLSPSLMFTNQFHHDLIASSIETNRTCVNTQSNRQFRLPSLSNSSQLHSTFSTHPVSPYSQVTVTDSPNAHSNFITGMNPQSTLPIANQVLPHNKKISN